MLHPAQNLSIPDLGIFAVVAAGVDRGKDPLVDRLLSPGRMKSPSYTTPPLQHCPIAAAARGDADKASQATQYPSLQGPRSAAHGNKLTCANSNMHHQISCVMQTEQGRM
jgi:hypothetical protein